MVTAGSSETVWWKCSLGHTWQALVSSRTRGNCCPYCSNKRILAGYNDLLTTHPAIAAEWDYSKNGTISPKEVSYGSTKKYWWICSNGHSYESPVEGRIRGRGCPICAGQKVLKGYNDLATVNPRKYYVWKHQQCIPVFPKHQRKQAYPMSLSLAALMEKPNQEKKKLQKDIIGE